MITLYNEILHKPLLNALIFFYNTIAFEDLGVAIILLTVLIRMILYPLFQKGIRHQTAMQRLQPKIKKLQDDYKGNKEKQMEAMIALYREHKVNPFSGIFIMILQLPILIALYRIFIGIFEPGFLEDLYSFVMRPAELHDSFLGLISLGKPSILIVGLAALAQYFQAKFALPPASPKTASRGGPKAAESGQTQAEKMGRQMVFIGPIITIVIFFNFPAAVALYWLATSGFSIIQQIFVNRHLEHDRLAITNKKTN